MARTQQLCLLQSLALGSGNTCWTQKPNPSIFPSSCSQEGDFSSKVFQFCMEVQKMSLGEQLGKLFRTNVMHIKQDDVLLSGTAV